MNAIPKPPAPKAERTLAGLRELLFDELDKLRSGASEPQQATATAALAKEILKAASLQLAYEKAWSEKKIGYKLRAITLVPDKPLPPK